MSRTRTPRGSRVGLCARAVMVGGVMTVGVLAINPVRGVADTQPTFAAKIIDPNLAGGEPFVIYSHAGNDLVYSAHEGTTHIFRGGVPSPGSSCEILPPGSVPSGYVCTYDNQVNIWYSTDGGNTWTKSPGNPLYTGFSDPSLTEDGPPASGSNPQNIYDTGIDLANDAVYASPDGGKTWVAGTTNCSEGDRPWLAGGQNGEVFMATDLVGPAPNGVSGHAYFHGRVTQVGGVNTTLTCNPNPIGENNFGAQDYFDRNGTASGPGDTGDIIQPDFFPDDGMGIGVLPDASNAWPSAASDPTNTAAPTCTGAPGGCFHDYEGTQCKTASDPYLCTELGPIAPEMAIDQGNTTYVVWATDPTVPNTTTGCSGSGVSLGGNAVLPNTVYMMYTSDEGHTWSQPLPIATPTTTGGTTVIWPWVTAGAAGNVAVVWYQANQLTDPDCDSAALQPGGSPTQWTLREASIFGATSASYPPPSVNTVPTSVCCDNSNNPVAHPGGVFHVGGVCQSGTNCVVTGQDRRLGDYFTDALDQNGCVMIASGDTQEIDPITQGQFSTGRPLFLTQASGPSLTNPNYTCSSSISSVSPNVPEVPWAPVLVFGGGSVAAFLVGRRRRNRL